MPTQPNVSMLENNKNTNEPLFSVIIPLYNKAPYIKRTLDSVLSQTIDNFEIVVVGGNSDDGGEDIVYGYTDSRIRFVREIDKGVSAARNQGINEAKGKYISFLDADDEWLPEYLEKIRQLILKYPNAGAYAASLYIVSHQKKITSRICNGISGEEDGIYNDFFEQCILGGRVINSSSTTIPREIFKKIGLFNINATEFEDHDMWCRVALFYDIVATTIPLVICHTECSEIKNRMLMNKVPVQIPFETYLNNMDKKILEKHPKYNSITKYIDYMNIVLAERCLTYGEREKARIILLKVHKQEYYSQKIRLYLSSFIPSGIYAYGLNVGSKIMRLIR